MPKKIPLRERFYSKTQKEDSGCIVWTGSTLGGGYGCFSIGGKTVYAHRTAWELERGTLPKGKRIVLDHLCRNRLCVNVEHLELVTFKENIIRGTGPTAINSKKTHCIHGHLLSPENIYFVKDRNTRHCKPCALLRASKFYYARKAITV